MTDHWNPEQYERFQKERNAPFYDLLQLVKPAPIAHAVDLGCGTGSLTRDLHRQLHPQRTLGLDNSAAMLEKAKSLSEPGLNFSLQDLALFHAPESYDLIFSNAALQWCEDHAAILRRLHESLRAGGQLAIQLPANQDYPTHTLATALAERAPYAQHIPKPQQGASVQTPEQYAVLLQRLGFRDQQVFLRVYPHLLPDREAVVEWVKGTLLTYYQSQLPPELFIRFVNDFQAELFQVLADEKPFFYPFKRIFLWARK